jgi:hypothetical protein
MVVASRILYVRYFKNVTPDLAAVNDSTFRSLTEVESVDCCQTCERLRTGKIVSQSPAEMVAMVSRRAGGCLRRWEIRKTFWNGYLRCYSTFPGKESTRFISRYQQDSLHSKNNNSPIISRHGVTFYQARWIPHQFSQQQKADRTTLSRDIFQMVRAWEGSSKTTW